MLRIGTVVLAGFICSNLVAREDMFNASIESWIKVPNYPLYIRLRTNRMNQQMEKNRPDSFSSLGDRNRWVDVVVRKSDGTILGWWWFENVVPGQEKGSPDE